MNPTENGLLFAHPWVLFLLWAIPPLAAWMVVSLRRRATAIRGFVDIAMQAKLAPPAATARAFWQTGLAAAAAALLIVAAARPQWGTTEEKVIQSGRDVVIALDVSLSMLAGDVHPSRLQRAKADLLDLVKELRGDRAALLAFRHKAVVVCPLTTDYAFLRQAIEGVDPGSAPRGETDVGEGLRQALAVFDTETPSHKAIVLVSDGEDLAGKAMDAAAVAGERRIPVFAIGLGSPNGAKIPELEDRTRHLQHEGKPVISKLENETLHAIARKTGGAYVPIQTAGTGSTTLGTIYRDHLRRISAQEIQETRQRRHVERFPVFLLPGILLAMACACLSRGRLKTRSGEAGRTAPAGEPPPAVADRRDLNPPKVDPRTLAVTAIAVLAGACAAMAETNPPPVASSTTPSAASLPGRQGGRLAQSLYRRGRHEEAARAYLAAAEAAAHSLRRDLRLNAAVCLQRAGKHDEAAALFEELALAEGEGDSAASTGLGIARFHGAETVTNGAPEGALEREALLAQAAEAFRVAVRSAEPDDKASRHDLEFASRRWMKTHEEAVLAKVLAGIGKSQPPEIAERVMREQRALAAACSDAFTNDAPVRLSTCEALSERQKHNALLLLPFKDRFLEAARQAAGTNDIASQIRQVDQFIEATRSVMSGAAEHLRDVDPEAPISTRSAAGGAYRLWKLVAPFPALLTQDILLQTNTVSMVEGRTPMGPVLSDETARTFQEDALHVTGLFSNRFEAAVPPEGLPGQPSTNAPPGTTNATEGGISPEDRAKVLALSAAAEREQAAALDRLQANDVTASLPHQREAYRLLLEIAALLPKQSMSSPQEQQEQQEQTNQQQKENTSNQQEQSKTNETASAQQPQPPQPMQAETNQTESASATNAPAMPQDVQTMLEKALMREREHEADLKRRNQRIPMQPGARDW
jgi:Ca-activated chloride channel family protein